MSVYETVRTKRATRKFSDQPIAKEDLTRILDAGRWSGSSKNNQPWHFIVLQERERLAALGECGQWARHLAGATVGIALVSGDWMERWPVAFDLGRSTQNMMLVAQEMGIGSVIANIYEIEKANALLGLPPDKMCYSAISFGYPAELDKFTRPPQAGAKRSLIEVVHWERW